MRDEKKKNSRFEPFFCFFNSRDTTFLRFYQPDSIRAHYSINIKAFPRRSVSSVRETRKKEPIAANDR